MKTQIKPCPFCGKIDCISISVEETVTGQYKGDKFYSVHCATCGNSTQFCRADSKEQLVEKWNKRP